MTIQVQRSEITYINTTAQLLCAQPLEEYHFPTELLQNAGRHLTGIAKPPVERIITSIGTNDL